MKFTKMQGLGNDYIYINAFEEQADDLPALARRMSDRHFGVGGDGLVLIAPSDKADFRMIMYNADGSRGAMCGNASRCVAKYVYDRGMTDKTVVTLETDSGVKTLNLTVENGKTKTVCVDMGAPILECEKVPCLLGQGLVKKAPITVLGRTFEITPVSMGNPHGVIFIDEPVEQFELDKYGPALEHHPAFPEKVNIEFVNVLSPTRLRMRVWERGSGITLACGTGSCAVLAAASLCGLADRQAEIDMVRRDLSIALETGAEIVIQHISAAEAVELVRQAKKKSTKIHAEATPHHFTLTEDAVMEHGTMAKMNPPLRTEADRQAIIRGLQDGTIDLIATDHAPHADYEKAKPLTEAPSGIIGLETSLALGNEVLVDTGELTMMQLLTCMTINPAKLYRLDAGYLAENGPADLVLFDPAKEWVPERFYSKSQNSPFLGQKLKGKVEYTICKGKVIFEA